MSGEDTVLLGGAPDHGTLLPGQSIGRYRIVSVLGQGGFGITYRATDAELGREVALKEYLPAALAVREHGTTVVPRSTAAAADFSWGRERFLAEGRTLAALHRAPGIVLVHDFLEANGTAYLVMELLAGTTLQQHLQRQGAMTPAAVSRILWPLLDGLEEVHKSGFLHRDIKPANILLDDAGRPTLIDFGASRAAVAGRSTAMTAIFTPGYAAAEQMTSAKQGPWTDIYGLAATLYHAITGAAPSNAIDRLLVDELEPLAKLALPGFDRALLAGIDAGLAVRAEHRPQSIADWRRLLQGPDASATVAMPAHATVALPAAAMAPPPASGKPPRRWGLWTGVALAVLALAGGGVYLVRGERAAPPQAVAVAPVDRSAEEAKLAAEAQRLREQEELVRLRAEAAAREKLEQEAAQRRQIEEETRRKVEAEIAERQRREQIEREKAEAEAQAEARRQAEARAAAAQKQTEEEEARRAEAEAEAQRKAEAEAQRKAEAERKAAEAAEAAEAALGLSTADRQRIQSALAAQGFPGASDGVFGPHTREMIAGWQRKTGRVASGYLTAEAQRELLRESTPPPPAPPPPSASPAASAPSAQAMVAPPPSRPPGAKGGASCDGTFSAQWCRGAYKSFPADCWKVPTTIQNGSITGSWIPRGRSEMQSFSGSISPAGEVEIVYRGVGTQTHTDQHFTLAMIGRVADGILSASGRTGHNGRDFSIRIMCR
ncbi:MAG: protein kinase [Proteobacteria bacterium]|nr:protein kinase [Pseudomonadota bacterium]